LHPIKSGMAQINRLLTAWLQVRVLPGELFSYLNHQANGGKRDCWYPSYDTAIMEGKHLTEVRGA